jgi:hypothetical protein
MLLRNEEFYLLEYNAMQFSGYIPEDRILHTL